MRWAAAVLAAGASAAPPTVVTPLGTAVGSVAADGVERYGAIPYALPPVGPRRFARAELNTQQWAGGKLDATLPGPPCIQNPLGDPRAQHSESGPPSEDCLHLNLWRPAKPSRTPRPVMVYLFGGGLCGGFAGNEYNNGSLIALKEDVILVTISYRLGALGFLPGDDAARPGSGGMNGLYDNVIALQWLKRYVSAFGGAENDITLFGQSSGAYSICTLSVAPAAKGLFRRASLLSGPCVGGPPGAGWGPDNAAKGRNVTALVLAAHNATTIADLRGVPADSVQWPDSYMNDLDKSPYFSGYFEDTGVLPASTDELWGQGAINPDEVMINVNSKDGTGSFYGTGPLLGLVPPDENTNTPAQYEASMRDAWGDKADAVLKQYPGDTYPTYVSAYVAADGQSQVICPSRMLARFAARAGKKVWASEYAHYQPGTQKPEGCSGWGAHGCAGWGCDNGPELDLVPGHRDETTKGWATHGAGYHFIFGTEAGPDGLGPPDNTTYCAFDSDEKELSQHMMAHWASFARHGNPNTGARSGALRWPELKLGRDNKTVKIQTMRFSVAATDGTPTALVDGIHDANCDFWDKLYQ